VKVSGPALLVTHLAVAGGTYAMTDRRPVDTEVKYTGFFQVDTAHVLSATVASLREEAQLKVFSVKVGSEVELDRTRFYLFGLHQKLTVPAAVSYFLDLSQLTYADVQFDEKAKLVRVLLPKITIGDIAFQPENATTVNGGLLSYSEEQVEEVRKANYAQARRAVVAQAQQSGFINAAKRQAIADVEQYFSIPLRIAGQPDVKVTATFK
jgi:hypothetical protein